MWTCWRADVLWIGADVGPCKKKRKKQRKEKGKKYILPEVGVSVRMGRVEALSCGHADGRADVWARGCGWL